jgi:hypothetical protein
LLLLLIWSKMTVESHKKIVAESLNIHKTAFLRILEEDLGMRMLCAGFVPQSLTTEQREDRVTSCQDIIAMADVDKNFF